jgi:hypothetical protein
MGCWGGDEEETGKQETNQTQTQTKTNYPETDAARQNWAQTLTDWGSSGTYGASLPNYDNIYSNAAKKINQYYWGGATGGGVIDKIKAQAAQRGVQDSPATAVLTSRMGAEEANKLGDLSTTVDTTKANAIESARTNWLSSLTNLANLSPQSTTSTGNSTTTSYAPSSTAMDALSSLLSGATQLGTSYLTGGASSGLSSIFDLLNTSSSGGVTSLANPYGSSYGTGLEF